MNANTRQYVFRILDQDNGDATLSEEIHDVAAEPSGATSANDAVKGVLIDAAVKRLMAMRNPPTHTAIEFFELQDPRDSRLSWDGDQVRFDWDACDSDTLHITIGEEN